MNKSIQSIQLDLDGNLMPPTVNVQKGDTNQIIRFSLWNGRNRYNLDEDILPVLSAKKPDGTSLYNICGIQDNEVVYAFTEQTANCPGLIKAELKLYGGNKHLITTMYFFIAVHDTVFKPEDAAKSKDEQNALDDLVSRTLDTRQEIEVLKNELQTKLQSGYFQGESAYEIAVRLGYSGTEAEWLQKLQYDHSAEFQALSQEVTEAAAAAGQSAEKSVTASNSAARSAQDATNSVEDAAALVTEAEAQAQTAAAAAEAAAKAEEITSARAAEAKTQADASLQSAKEARNEADRAAEILKNTATMQEAAPAIQEELTGSIIATDMVSPLSHIIHCKVNRINLFDVSRLTFIEDFFDSGNGGFTIQNRLFFTNSPLRVLAPDLKIGETYYLNYEGDPYSAPYLVECSLYWPCSSALTITQEILNSRISFYSHSDLSPCIYKNVQISTGILPFSPYVKNLKNINIDRYGRNLLQTDRSLASHGYLTSEDPRVFDFSSCYSDYTQDGSSDSGKNTDITIGTDFCSFKTSSCSYGIGWPIPVKGGELFTATAVLKNAQFVFSFFNARGVNIGGSVSSQCIVPKESRIVLLLLLSLSTDQTAVAREMQLAVTGVHDIYEPYISPTTYTTSDNGFVPGIKSTSDVITLTTHFPGVELTMDYNIDIGKYIKNLIDRITALENSF